MELPSLLFAALNSPNGISVKTTDSAKLRSRLYPVKKADPTFSNLHFVIPAANSTTTLWIVKKPEA
jgi:hypothetical protein